MMMMMIVMTAITIVLLGDTSCTDDDKDNICGDDIVTGKTNKMLFHFRIVGSCVKHHLFI